MFATINLSGSSCNGTRPLEFRGDNATLNLLCDSAERIQACVPLRFKELFNCPDYGDWNDQLFPCLEEESVMGYLTSDAVVAAKHVSLPDRRIEHPALPSAGTFYKDTASVLAAITPQSVAAYIPEGPDAESQLFAWIVYQAYTAWLLRMAMTASDVTPAALAAELASVAAAFASKENTLVLHIDNLVQAGHVVMFQEASDSMLALLQERHTVHTESKSTTQQTVGIILPAGMIGRSSFLSRPRCCSVVATINRQAVLLVSLHGTPATTNGVIADAATWGGGVVIGTDGNVERKDLVTKGMTTSIVGPTTDKTRTWFQSQYNKAEHHVARESDYIISTGVITESVRYPARSLRLPTPTYPTDHYTVMATISFK